MDTTSRSESSAYSTRKARLLLWILLFAGLVEFLIRGPLRNLRPTNWNDIAQLYAASRLWLRGQNFCQPETFVALWRNEVGATLGADTLRTRLAPLPGTLVLLAPIGALPWAVAKLVWLAVLLASFGLTVWALLKASGIHLQDPRTLGFIAGCLALAPFQTGIATANETVLVVGLCALGIGAAGGGRDVAAGLLFGAACSLKPHIGSFLVLYYLIQRRWRLFATALGFTAALALAAIFWMQVRGVSVAHDYFRNLGFLAAHDRFDDFTSWNPARFLLINLQVPFYSLTGSARASNVLALAVGTLLIAAWIFLITRRRAPSTELLPLAAISVIGLLPVYHRFYDASILAIPFCWCLTELRGELRRFSRIALCLMAPFLVPGPAVLQQLAERHQIPGSWSDAWWWNCVVMPHETWLLLALSLVLMYGLTQKQRVPAQA